jgi:hypothetical protein
MKHRPPSYLVKGIKAMPEKTVGIPMVKPEKSADPPRDSAYKAAEETVTKKANYSSLNYYLPCNDMNK